MTIKKTAKATLAQLPKATPAPSVETVTLTQADVAQVEILDAPEAVTPSVDNRVAIAGNIMYINENVKNANQVYLTFMARFEDDNEIENEVVSHFMNKADFHKLDLMVGDLIAVRAKGMAAGNTFLDDGTPVRKLVGLDRAYGTQVLHRKVELIETQKTGNAIQSPILSKVLGNVSRGLKAWFGITD